MAMLRKCCCCCQLRTGGIVIGWCVLVLCFFLCIIHCLCLTNHRNILDFEEDGEYKLDFSPAFKYGHGAAAIFSFLMALSALLLVIGAMKKSVNLILPFLISFMFFLVISLIIALIVSFASDSGAISNLFREIILSALGLYWWLCVLSLYQEIKE